MLFGIVYTVPTVLPTVYSVLMVLGTVYTVLTPLSPVYTVLMLLVTVSAFIQIQIDWLQLAIQALKLLPLTSDLLPLNLRSIHQLSAQKTGKRDRFLSNYYKCVLNKQLKPK